MSTIPACRGWSSCLTGESVDMQPRKISVAAILQLQRALESAPECSVEEVTKVQAIRMLVPQIQTMQAKGYSLNAIAAMLSENGITVTGVTLKSYLNQLRAAGRKKSARKGQRPRRSQDALSGPAAQPSSLGGVGEGGAPPAPKGSPEAGGRRESVVPAAPPSVHPPAATPTSSRRAGPAVGEGAARRSAFLPKEDTEEI
jgi:hypothetical protein